MKVKIYVFIISIQFLNLNALPRGFKRQTTQFETIDVSFITPDQSMILSPPLEVEPTTLPTMIDQISTQPSFMIIDQPNLTPVIIATPEFSSFDGADIDSDESSLINGTQMNTGSTQIRPASDFFELITETPVLDTNQQTFSILDSDSMDSFFLN
ncbi:hypothetical protein BpHYR1_045931 [Brachionus plicatilis]|uniref:Uncharacterized protein n=1 Tax=Brachionus plicatilis TaxID=10195 RepID=A0A3M7P7L6_BRAPC|nr:hypothetical protein BpHYR1_045931 [Brachionus plicatilis]